ncbi:MAG: hypothetical protein QW379_06430 [Thermoplasmata archaeon]
MVLARATRAAQFGAVAAHSIHGSEFRAVVLRPTIRTGLAVKLRRPGFRKCREAPSGSSATRRARDRCVYQLAVALITRSSSMSPRIRDRFALTLEELQEDVADMLRCGLVEPFGREEDGTPTTFIPSKELYRAFLHEFKERKKTSHPNSAATGALINAMYDMAKDRLPGLKGEELKKRVAAFYFVMAFFMEEQGIPSRLGVDFFDLETIRRGPEG